MPHLPLSMRLCLRLPWLLAGLLAVAPVPAQLPPRVQAQLAAMAASAATSAPAAATGASAGAGAGAGVGPALQLVFTRALLPDGRRDEPYTPVMLARGGNGGYAVALVQGALPDGLQIVAGVLQGTPLKEGRKEFVLEVRDGASPPQVVRQPYSLSIAPPKVARAAARPASAPAPAGVPKGGFAEETIVRADKGFVVSYTLRKKHLEELAPVDPGADAAAEGAVKEASAKEALTLLRQLQDKLRELGLPVAPIDAKAWAAEVDVTPPPTKPGQTEERPVNLAQLNELLKPLVDVEYPTLALFDGALRGRQCQYLRDLLDKAFLDRNPGKTPPRVDCPGPVAPSGKPPAGDKNKAAAARAAVWPLRVFHDSLLPAEVRERAIELARELHPIDQASQLAWTAAPCGCVPRQGEDTVYGLFPFWRAAKAPLPAIDFSRFHRISTLGLQLDDDMKFPTPPGWQERMAAFSRLAQRHDVRVDLLLQRNDWQLLERQTPDGVKALAERAADNAVLMADQALGGSTPLLNALTLPLWRQPEQAFGGITVMFEEGPELRPRPGSEVPPFHHFYRAFMLRLISQMQTSRRSYALNIVVPNEQVGIDGAFSWTQLVEFIHLAERKDNRTIPEGSNTSEYVGTTDITVSLLVPLPEPVTLTKKQLRRRIDDNQVVTGHNRVALLNSIVPVIFHPSGAGAPPLVKGDADQLNDDLAYYKWNFGGVAFWPPPVAGQGGGDQVLDLLGSNFFRNGRTALAGQVCTWVCPNRTLFHLAWQGFTLAALLSLAMFRYACSLRRHATLMKLLSWATGIVAVALTIALVTCDPALAALDGNVIAIALLVAIGLVLAWRSARPDVTPP